MIINTHLFVRFQKQIIFTDRDRLRENAREYKNESQIVRTFTFNNENLIHFLQSSCISMNVKRVLQFGEI